MAATSPVYGVLEHVSGTLLTDAFKMRTDGRRVISPGAASGQPTTDKGQLDAQIGYRDSWHNFDAAIDALLGRKVAGKVALTVS